MKKPEKPPDFHETIQSLDSNRAVELMVSANEVNDSRYFHWDELRHRPAPSDWSHQEWWLVLKSARKTAQRKTPFTDSEGDRFSYTLPDQVLEKLHWIDSRAHGQIGSADLLPSTEQRSRYIIRSLMEEAITSSQLEGAATTRKVALEMLRSGRRPRTHSEHMIRNNYQAMREIRRISSDPLSMEGVLNLHEILTENTLKNPDSAGRLQTPEDERVHVYDRASQQILHAPPPASELPGRLDRLVRYANGMPDSEQFIHPVLRAVLIHFMLAYDHPFEDGNGRTARALFYWSMLQQGYWLTEFISISRLLKKAPARYLRSFLYTETDENDLTYFFLYQLDVITIAIEDLGVWLKRKASENTKLERTIGATKGLNHRQRALLVHALKHPHQMYTIESHQKSHDIAYATSRADLYGLAEEGWLNKSKSGRRMVFTPGDRLQATQSRQ